MTRHNSCRGGTESNRASAPQRSLRCVTRVGECTPMGRSFPPPHPRSHPQDSSRLLHRSERGRERERETGNASRRPEASARGGVGGGTAAAPAQPERGRECAQKI